MMYGSTTSFSFTEDASSAEIASSDVSSCVDVSHGIADEDSSTTSASTVCSSTGSPSTGTGSPKSIVNIPITYTIATITPTRRMKLLLDFTNTFFLDIFIFYLFSMGVGFGMTTTTNSNLAYSSFNHKAYHSSNVIFHSLFLDLVGIPPIVKSCLSVFHIQ